MNYEFEEDDEPTWVTHQNSMAELVEQKYNKKIKPCSRFIFVKKHHWYKYKSYYRCPDCAGEFLSADGYIKSRVKCKLCGAMAG